MFSPVTEVSSMMPNVVFGNFGATFFMAGAYEKPTPMTGLLPLRASSVRRWTLSASPSPSVGSASAVLILRSFLAFSRPAKAASLNDWSPRPPMSYAMAALAAAAPADGEELVSDDFFPPQAVAERASAADAMPTVAILVIRRKGRLLQNLTEAPRPALVSRRS